MENDVQQKIARPLSLRQPREEEAPAEPAGEREPRVAVVVVHGMGQQQPFQTLDRIVHGLAGHGGQGTEVRLVRAGDETLPRAEVPVRSGGKERTVHFYEAYWAPLTQGKVTLRDVLAFLVSAGKNGLKNASRSFSRFMFGKEVSFGRSRRTTAYLLTALAVLGALIVVNLVAGAITGAILTGKASRWVAPGFFADVSCVLAGLVALLAVTLAWMFARKSMTAMYLAFGSIVAAGLLLVVHAFRHQNGAARPWFELDSRWLFVGLWLLVFGFSLRVRSLMVQYVGDVAAYVASHRLDRFAALRASIKAAVLRTARAVYEARDASGAPLYDRIVLVAHSLGSVVAYDTLNALLVEDELEGGALGVKDRTKALVTFGSPLDKIAFLFKTQSHGSGCTRENLAAAKQPLIQDYSFRRGLRWVNIHAPADIISGALDFFDDAASPDAKKHGVENRVDDRSTTPLKAHVQYWHNPLLFETLRDVVMA